MLNHPSDSGRSSVAQMLARGLLYRAATPGQPGVRTEKSLLGGIWTFELVIWCACIGLDALRKESQRAGRRRPGISQAQGSTGCLLLATAVGTTDPTMEQGLEAPGSGHRCGQPQRVSR